MYPIPSIKKLYAEAYSHREEYKKRFPFINPDKPVGLDKFLSMHPAGTFPTLERIANSELPGEVEILVAKKRTA